MILKVLLKSSLLAALIFGVFMTLFFIMAFGLKIGTMSGVASAALFGTAIFIFTFVQSKKFDKVRVQLSKNNKILFDIGANHFKGKEAVGGWLFLTEEKVIFMSHAMNIQNHNYEITYNAIERVEKHNILFLHNGLKIFTKNGKMERFIINSRNMCFDIIQSKLKQ